MYAAALCRSRNVKTFDDEKDILDVVFVPSYPRLLLNLPSSFNAIEETADLLSTTFFDSSKVVGFRKEIEERLTTLNCAGPLPTEFQLLLKILVSCEKDASTFLVMNPHGEYSYPEFLDKRNK